MPAASWPADVHALNFHHAFTTAFNKDREMFFTHQTRMQDGLLARSLFREKSACLAATSAALLDHSGRH